MSCHEFTFHVSTPDDPQRIWDLELCYPSDERLSAAMATLPSIEGQAPLSYPVHATKQAPPMIPLSHRIAIGQGQSRVAAADVVMRESQISSRTRDHRFERAPVLLFSAIIMGPHGARFEAIMARDVYRRTCNSLRLSGDELFSSGSEDDSLPDLVSITDDSLSSESVDVDLGICQLCFESHHHTPWDCPQFGITAQEVSRSRESNTAVGSNRSVEKIGEDSSQDDEEVHKAFKDFTIVFDVPEDKNDNENEFRSVVDMLEHEAADGLRALAAGLRVEHAAVDELREIEDGLRRLETEERAADPVRDDSPYPRLIRKTRGYARARAQHPTAILQRAQRPPIAFHFNPRAGDIITRDAWSSSASDSLESSSSEPLTPYDNDDHNTYRADNETFTAEELEIRNFYESISPGDWSPAISDWSVEEFDLFPPFRPNPAHIIDLAIGRVLNERYLPGSRFPSDLDSNNNREDAEAAADKFVDYVAMAAEGVTNLHHPPSPPPYSVSLFVDTLNKNPHGSSLPTSLDFSLSTAAHLPVSAECSTQVGQGYEEEGFAGQVVGTLASGADTGKGDAEGEGAEMRPKTGTKQKLSDGEAAEGEDHNGTRKRKSPKTSKFFGDSLRRKVLNREAVKVTGLTDDNVVRLMAGVRLALLETGSRLEDMVWHRYRVTDRFFPSRYLHHPLLFDLEVAKLQTIWSILQCNGRVHLADKLHELLSIRLRRNELLGPP
ncbi:hypothetical protein B0H14DRAFT_2616286 [Mycena olivaceomarginata]|nr:hypothetical protein B0H14DRAFT_2616286 [Mycena olivaceomarginata]